MRGQETEEKESKSEGKGTLGTRGIPTSQEGQASVSSSRPEYFTLPSPQLTGQRDSDASPSPPWPPSSTRTRSTYSRRAGPFLVERSDGPDLVQDTQSQQGADTSLHG